MIKLELIVEVHQPMRLRTYRFSEIGVSHYYYDDYENEYYTRKVSEECYIPMNEILIRSVHNHDKRLRLALRFSGIVLDQFELYAPEVVKSYKSLLNSGNVKLLTGSYSHTLKLPEGYSEVTRQFNLQKKRIRYIFGNNPVSYNGKHITESDPGEEGIAVVVRDDSSGEYLTSRFAGSFLNQRPDLSEQLRICADAVHPGSDCSIILIIPHSLSGDYNNKWLNDLLLTLPDNLLSGSHRPAGADSLKAMNSMLERKIEDTSSKASDHTCTTISAMNEMQKDAFYKLYSLSREVEECSDAEITKDWLFLQSCDNFYFMDQSLYENGNRRRDLIPYDSPFLAYINYMNVLEDFSGRLNSLISRKIKINRPAFDNWKKALERCLMPNLFGRQGIV